MIEAKASVVAIDKDLAWVETARPSACGACHQEAACGTAILGRLFIPRANPLAVRNDLGVTLGERVIVGVPDGVLVRASLAAYLLPLGALVAGAGLAEWFGAGDAVVALAGIAGLGAGLLLCARFANGAVEAVRYRPVLLRREGPDALRAHAPLSFDPVPGPWSDRTQPKPR